MLATWGTLLPLIVASALVPLQLMITVVLLRVSWKTAASWVAGMAAMRFFEAMLLAAAVAAGLTVIESRRSPSDLASYLLLAVGVLFYLAALQQAIRPTDAQAATAQWLAKAESLSPLAAFGTGAAYLTISVKSTVLNLAGIAVLIRGGDEGLQLLAAAAVFILLAQVGHVAILGVAASSPTEYGARVAAISTWLERHSRAIVIVMGLVFGTWFVGSALRGLGAF